MNEISRSKSWRFLLLLISVSLQFLPGLSGDSETGKKVETHSKSSRSNGSVVILVVVMLVAVALFSFFLFKFWQKKKREEQYARLLKLFEEDDDLELELGLRDWPPASYNFRLLLYFSNTCSSENQGLTWSKTFKGMQNIDERSVHTIFVRNTKCIPKS